MPSGYLKNAERVSDKIGRGSSSKDGKGKDGRSPKHSPKGRRSPVARSARADAGTDGGEDRPPPSARSSSPKLKGPAARNPTKELVKEIARNVEPNAVAHARVTGLRLKASACTAAFEDFDEDDKTEVDGRVDRARAPLVEAVRLARAAAAALSQAELTTSRALGELRIAETTLEAFDSIPTGQFAKRDRPIQSGMAAGGGGVPGKTYEFQTINEPEWANVTKWTRLKRGEYDPSTLDLLGEPLGDGVADSVVELPCSTPPALRCVFRESIIRKCLQSNPRCPTCAYQFAIPGPQPSGRLTIELADYACEGYPRTKTITMFYSFPGGTQGPRMKRPGQPYYGTSRMGYLPDNPQGRDAAALLTKAFMAGGLFVVADSVTTGAQNCVVWGGVHQKTSPSGGAQYHGWPDPTYFERLLYECAAVGVFTDAQEKAMLLDARKAKKAAAAAAAAVVTSDAAEVEPAATSPPTDERAAALQARIEQIGVEIQAAMKARKTEDIRALMSERTTTQAELKALTP